MDSALRQKLADQALVYAVIWFVSCRTMRDDGAKLMLGVLRSALKAGGGERPDLQPFVEIAERIDTLAGLDPARRGPDWSRVMLDGSGVVEGWARARVVKILEQLEGDAA